MKRLLLLLTCLPLLAATSASFNLTWDSNSESDLAGYRLYSKSGTNDWSMIQEIGLTNRSAITITNLTRFHLTAFNTSGMESGPSNELMLNPVPPSPPSKMRLEKMVLTYTP